MATANEEIQDKFIAHQVAIVRYSQGLARQYQDKIALTSDKLQHYVLNKLDRLNSVTSASSNRAWRQFGKSVAEIRQPGFQEAREFSFEEMDDLAKMEQAAAANIINSSIPIEYPFALVPSKPIVKYATFEGMTLGQWWTRLAVADSQRIVAEARNGVALGLTNNQIATNIRSAIGTTNNGAEMMARTTANGIANEAKDQFYKENKDVIDGVVWTATLDARTSEICMSLDGKRFRVDKPHPVPPAHFSCRSVLIPVLDGVGLIGTRPTVGGTNFRTVAREKAGDKWKNYSTGRRASETAKARKAYGKNVIGSVPAETTYAEFLKRQPKSFQVEVLGKQKAEWFREGKLTVDKMVNPRTLKPLTLDEIRKREGL